MKRIAVITGASSGMGREFAHRIAAEYQIDEMWVIARRLDRLEELAGEIAIPVVPIALDLTDAESIHTCTYDHRRKVCGIKTGTDHISSG